MSKSGQLRRPFRSSKSGGRLASGSWVLAGSGAVHLPAYKKNGLRVIGGYDISPSALDQAASVGLPFAYRSLDEVLDDSLSRWSTSQLARRTALKWSAPPFAQVSTYLLKSPSHRR